MVKVKQNNQNNYTRDIAIHQDKLPPSPTSSPATPLSDTLLGAALKGGAVIGAIGCAAELYHSPNPRQDAIQSLKKFAIGCGLELLAFPILVAMDQMLRRIFPPDSTKTKGGQRFEELATTSPTRTIIKAPIIEELAFRKTVQQGIFYQALSFGMRLFSLDARNLLDTKIAKICRVGATALLFGALHLMNKHHTAHFQAILAIFSGMLLGVLKESTLGLPAAIGMHMTNNALVFRRLQQAKRNLTKKPMSIADLNRGRVVKK